MWGLVGVLVSRGGGRSTYS